MERALMEQQARAHQAAPALQALQRQQTAQQAQRWAAAQAPAHGGSVVVDTRLLGKSVAFDGRVTLEVVQVPIRSSQWSHRPSICWRWERPGTWQQCAPPTRTWTRVPSAQLYDMLMVVRQEGPQKLLESRSCFADTARCWARV